MSARVRVGRRDIELTHPDKVLFPRAKLTKRDLAGHYERAAPLMLPYVKDRPIAMQAFPNGIDGYGYFMKAVPDYFPRWVRRATVAKRGGSVTHVLLGDAVTLVYLAGQNVITLHAWLSRADQARRPDRLIIDFDPSGTSFAEVRAAAREAGARLRERGLVPYAMVTGSRGVHVVCPLRRGPSFGDVHRFARALAEEMVADDRRLTLEWHKAERGDRIYVDVNRNAYATARRDALCGAQPASGSGGGAARMGRAFGPPAATRPLDREERRRAPRRRSVGGHGPASAGTSVAAKRVGRPTARAEQRGAPCRRPCAAGRPRLATRRQGSRRALPAGLPPGARRRRWHLRSPEPAPP